MERTLHSKNTFPLRKTCKLTILKILACGAAPNSVFAVQIHGLGGKVGIRRVNLSQRRRRKIFEMEVISTIKNAFPLRKTRTILKILACGATPNSDFAIQIHGLGGKLGIRRVNQSAPQAIFF